MTAEEKGEADLAGHCRRLERSYRDSPWGMSGSASLTVSRGSAEIALARVEALFDPPGSVNGLPYFKLLDDAALYAASSVVPGAGVKVTSFNVYLTRPVASGALRAVARVVGTTESLIMVQADLADSAGCGVASASACFVRTG